MDGAGKGAGDPSAAGVARPAPRAGRAFGAPDDAERARPPMWRYWRDLPPRGEIGVVFGSWYTEPLQRASARRQRQGPVRARAGGDQSLRGDADRRGRAAAQVPAGALGQGAEEAARRVRQADRRRQPRARGMGRRQAPQAGAADPRGAGPAHQHRLRALDRRAQRRCGVSRPRPSGAPSWRRCASGSACRAAHGPLPAPAADPQPRPAQRARRARPVAASSTRRLQGSGRRRPRSGCSS